MKVTPLPCKRLDLRVAWMTTLQNGSPVSGWSRLDGDVKIVSLISTSLVNTLDRLFKPSLDSFYESHRLT